MTSVLAALINGAILSAPITVAVWLGLRLAPRRGLNAATRYVVWWVTLAVATILPAVYLPIQPLHLVERLPWLVRVAQQGTARRAVTLRTGSGFQKTPSGDSVFSVKAATSSDAPSADGRLFLFELPAGRWPQWIVAAWALVTSLLLARLIVSCVLLGRRKERAFAAPAELTARMDEWLARCGSKRTGVRIAGSAEISAPVATGPRRPAILIPARLFDELDEGELEQVGVHEAAHLARGDDYALILQRVVEALFALHPVVRWITRRIDLEREIACDDFVVEATGRPREYAACLTHLVEITGGVRAPLVAAAAAEESSHLARRVEMLLDKTRHTGTRLLKIRLTGMVAALAALACMAAKTPRLVAFTTRSDIIERGSALKIPERLQGRQDSQVAASDREGPPPLLAAVPAKSAGDRTTQATPMATTPSLALSAAARRPAQQTTALAQATAPPDRPAMLVSIPVEVTDPRNRFVTGLDKDNFRLFEDGVEQEIAQFSSEDVPLSVGIVFDVRSNVDGRLDRSRQAVARFFDNAHPQDEFFLAQFTDRPHLITGFTTNSEKIQNKLTVNQAGKAALPEVIHTAVDEFKKAGNLRKILLVISDGVDNDSRYRKSETENLVREANIRVYVLGISEPSGRPYLGRSGDEYVAGPALLREVAEQTGGRYFVVENLAQAPDVAAKISVELRNLYVLGYSPKNTIRDGQYRKVQVELVQPRGLPPLEATFRPGYYAPVE